MIRIEDGTGYCFDLEAVVGDMLGRLVGKRALDEEKRVGIFKRMLERYGRVIYRCDISLNCVPTRL